MTDCIIKTRSLDRDGYPKIVKTKNRKRTSYRLARYLYIQRFGEIKKGNVIDHLCRNRACINIDHLEEVSVAENTRRGKSAKITKEEVIEIRRLYKERNFIQKELADMYKIGQDQISRIINERRWA